MTQNEQAAVGTRNVLRDTSRRMAKAFHENAFAMWGRSRPGGLFVSQHLGYAVLNTSTFETGRGRRARRSAKHQHVDFCGKLVDLPDGPASTSGPDWMQKRPRNGPKNVQKMSPNEQASVGARNALRNARRRARKCLPG